MTALADALDAAGIVLRRIQAGNHRAPCPKCDRGARDDAQKPAQRRTSKPRPPADDGAPMPDDGIEDLWQ